MPRINAKNVTSEDDIKGRQRPAVGKYHGAINYWDESLKDGDYIKVELQVLDGEVAGQQGRTIEEKLFLSEKAIDRLTRFCLAAKMVKPGEEIDRDLTNEANGKQLVFEVVPHKYTNKDGKEVETVQCAFMGFWSLDNPEVAAVPKNAAAMKLIGQTAPPANNGNGNGGQSQQTVANGAATGSSDWGDV